MLEVKAILELAKKSDYKNPYLNTLNKRYLDDNNKDIEMLDIKYIISISNYFINKYTTST